MIMKKLQENTVEDEGAIGDLCADLRSARPRVQVPGLTDPTQKPHEIIHGRHLGAQMAIWGFRPQVPRENPALVKGPRPTYNHAVLGRFGELENRS